MRSEVYARLSTFLPGKNLHDLARSYAVTIEKDGKTNKGWVGQTLEKVADLDAGNAPVSDGLDFELKSTSLVRRAERWEFKEAIRVTQLNPRSILEEQFETSVLWNKLARLILVGCHHETPRRCLAIKVTAIDLTDPALIEELRLFWEDVRHLVFTGEIFHFSNLGSTNGLMQLRPTGDGRQWSTCPTTGERFPARAFYGTKRLLNALLDQAPPSHAPGLPMPAPE